MRSSETSAKLGNKFNNAMSDSNDRYGVACVYQKRNEDNANNNSAATTTKRKYRQQKETFEEHVVSKLPEKSFTRQAKMINIDTTLFIAKKCVVSYDPV